MPMTSLRRQEDIRFSTVSDFVDEIFGEDMHAKRVESLACATLGALHSCSLAVRLIGQGLAQAHELKQKHCIKQVDRLRGRIHCALAAWAISFPLAPLE